MDEPTAGPPFPGDPAPEDPAPDESTPGADRPAGGAPGDDPLEPIVERFVYLYADDPELDLEAFLAEEVPAGLRGRARARCQEMARLQRALNRETGPAPGRRSDGS